MSFVSARGRRLRSPLALIAAFGVCAVGGGAVIGSLGGCKEDRADASAPADPAHDEAVVAYDPTKSLAPMLAVVGPAVVSVYAQGVAAPGGRAHGTGSGFVIDPSGLIVTNHHVVDGATAIHVRMSDGRRFDARIVGHDPATDLALLQLDAAADLPTVELGTSGPLAVGDWVVAVGNPMGLHHSATVGIVSGKGRGNLGLYEDSFLDFLQTDADIAPGSSGGPLFDLKGHVVGINTAVGGGNGPGFAIPIDQARRVIDQLRTHGRVSYGWLGASNAPDDEIGDGARIGRVYADTPAADAGLHPGDLVVAIDGDRIASFHELRARVATTEPGTQIELTIHRDDATLALPVTLRARPQSQALAKLDDAPIAPAPPTRGEPPGIFDRLFGAGPSLEAEPAPARLSLGARVRADADGLVVIDVQADSLAQRLGLRPGDRIVAIAGTPVRTGDELRAAIAKVDRTIEITYERDGQRFDASYERS